MAGSSASSCSPRTAISCRPRRTTSFHHARHHDDLLFPDPSIPRCWETSCAHHDRRADLAFPKINLLSWYVYTLGGVHRRRHGDGGVDTGWTFYTPYSSTYANTNVILTALGVFITGFSSILTA